MSGISEHRFFLTSSCPPFRNSLIYSELHLSWLDLMDRLRRTGMSIAQMRQYTVLVKQGSKTLHQRQRLLSQHRLCVEQTIAEWTQALKLIDSKIDFYGEWLTTGKRPKLPTVNRSLKPLWRKLSKNPTIVRRKS